MLKPGEQILSEIDATLDQLIHNAHALQSISSNTEFCHETEALQKVQESLLARLLHMNEFLDAKRRHTIEDSSAIAKSDFTMKLTSFEKLNSEMLNKASNTMDHTKHKAKVRIRRHRRMLKIRKLAD